jgi:hypothetical protein
MKKEYIYPLILFLLINVLLYFWINIFHSTVPFNKFDYTQDASHYIQDPRSNGQPFSLVNALGQYDSQWYLRIADKGYPIHPKHVFVIPTTVTGVILYNFFPFYPLCIALVNFFIRNIQLSAFILSDLFLLASVYSIYFVVSKWFTKEVAIKTILLLLLFPFSIFLRGYYAEELRLLLFIWFCYGLSEKKYLIASLSVGLLCVTSGISLLLLPFYGGVLWFAHNKQKLQIYKIILYGTIAVVPFLIWMAFCYINTGNFLIFFLTRAAWFRPPYFPLLYNLGLIISLPSLPLISFYGSKMDVIFIILSLCMAYLSESVLPEIVWLATIILVFSPLVVQDSISFARFSCVFFPFFVYLAVILKKKYYISILCLFVLGLLVSSLFFVNWYWIE